MGATLSQPYIPMPPKSIKSKSKKRPRYLFRLRIRWKKKRTFPEIHHAPFPNPGRHDHREESSDSKLYHGSSAEGEDKYPSSDRLPISFFTTEKPLPKLPLQMIAPAAQFPGQQTQLNSSSELPKATEASQPIINTTSENTNQEDDNEEVSDSDSEDSNFSPEIERPHTPPPWDTSLSGYGSVLEVSRPFRARRVFEHPLVEGHFLGSYQGDSFFMSGGGGGPIAAAERRRMWRVWESTEGKEKGTAKEKGKGKGKHNEVGDEWKKGELKSGRQKATEGRERERKRERERGKKRIKTKTKRRMSEWRKWKPLPRYPACTGCVVVVVAQRTTSSTWAAAAATATGDSDSTWREVFVEEAEDREYQGGDEEEEEEDENEGDDMGEEDLEEAIKRFLEMKIPVDLSSLRRLRTNFAGTAGEHTMTGGSGTGETAKKDSEKEVLEKVMEGEQGQGQLSPVESLMFTDTDIEGFEFLIEEEDEGGGIWDSEPAAGVKSERVEGKSEAYHMDRPIGGFAGGDTSRAENSSEDAEHHLTVRTAFNITQRLSRWKERE